ncbi:hypothetical protein BGZ61DRAFT_181070 [Ilyonectria robusta]|uniref:uncharacterized protein n=1 Tax=Ilyonectria robusta TaxID=1079257 RepID=UPI001E8ED157|nr:uncharacterized protein BGZ61DRAFT_181070 [Ilyonectria robusta]KAH8729385.1 hypothetical protein BGZ61DRAFT_181070 [Ilyonectria robusta]
MSSQNRHSAAILGSTHSYIAHRPTTFFPPLPFTPSLTSPRQGVFARDHKWQRVHVGDPTPDGGAIRLLVTGSSTGTDAASWFLCPPTRARRPMAPRSGSWAAAQASSTASTPSCQRLRPHHWSALPCRPAAHAPVRPADGLQWPAQGDAGRRAQSRRVQGLAAKKEGSPHAPHAPHAPTTAPGRWCSSTHDLSRDDL